MMWKSISNQPTSLTGISDSVGDPATELLDKGYLLSSWEVFRGLLLDIRLSNKIICKELVNYPYDFSLLLVSLRCTWSVVSSYGLPIYMIKETNACQANRHTEVFWYAKDSILICIHMIFCTFIYSIQSSITILDDEI